MKERCPVHPSSGHCRESQLGPGAPTLTSIADALLTNTQNVGDAILNLPGLVITDIATEVQNLLTDVAGGESLNAAFDAGVDP